MSTVRGSTSSVRQPLGNEAYTIGLMCALWKERVAIMAVLDEEYPELSQESQFSGPYRFGRIKGYNIVIEHSICDPQISPSGDGRMVAP